MAVQSREAGKKYKPNPAVGHGSSISGTLKDTSNRPSPVGNTSTRKSAEQLRRADIERRLNSALGSHKTSKTQKFQAPEKHAMRGGQPTPPSKNRRSPGMSEQPSEGGARVVRPRIIELKQDSLAQRNHSSAASKHSRIPKPKQIANTTQDSRGGDIKKQGRNLSTDEELSPPRSEKPSATKTQAKLPPGCQPGQSSGPSEAGEAAEDLPSLGSELAEVAPPAEAPVSQAEGTAIAPREASAKVRRHDRATADPLTPDDLVSSRGPSIEEWSPFEPQTTPLLAELAGSKLGTQKPVSRAADGTGGREPSAKGLCHVIEVAVVDEAQPVAEVPQKPESTNNRTADFEFGANFIPLF